MDKQEVIDYIAHKVLSGKMRLEFVNHATPEDVAEYFEFNTHFKPVSNMYKEYLKQQGANDD